jgi:predicted small secreted protein
MQVTKITKSLVTKKIGVNMKYFILFIATLSLTACNTIGGLGKDIQGAAEYTSTKINTPQPEKAKQ